MSDAKPGLSGTPKGLLAPTQNHLLSIYSLPLHKDTQRSKDESSSSKANGKDTQCDQKKVLVKQRRPIGREGGASREGTKQRKQQESRSSQPQGGGLSFIFVLSVVLGRCSLFVFDNTITIRTSRTATMLTLLFL